MGRTNPSQGVGSIALVVIVVFSMCTPAVVGGGAAVTTELVVETQDKIDDDGNLGADENTDNDNVYSEIQAAVNAAPDGALINVTEGTYNESVVVDKPNLVIVGDPGDTALAGAGNTAPVLDSNGINNTAIKLTPEADNVVIEGFEIQNYALAGVFPEVGSTENFENLTVRDNTISGVDFGVGLLNRNDDAVFRDIDVRNNKISNVNFGVNIVGSTGVSDIMDVTVSENMINGASRDGVQIRAASGIAEIRNIVIAGNSINDVQRQGIELIVDGDSVDNAESSVTSAVVRDNIVTNAETGLDIRSLSPGDVSSVDVHHNVFRDNVNGTSHTTGTTNEISVRYNVYENNSMFAIETSSDDLLLAHNNWYNATSGPTVSSNPGGSGDAVSENVSYDPFLTRVVNVGDGGASIGNTTTVDVTADAGNVAGYEVTVEFNESVLNVTNVEDADFTAPVTNVDNENGSVTFTQSQSTGVDKPTLARIEFNVTGEGESDVTVTSAGLYDTDGEAISSVSFEEGLVESGIRGSGDVNGDGQVNAGDVVLLQQYLVGDDVNIDMEAADVDGDGDIDAADALDIQQEYVVS